VLRLDRRKMQPLARPAIEALRGELGLPALGASIFQQWVHSPLLGITLFPEWFAQPTPDWPAPLVQAGFPLWDGDAGAGLEPELAAFLEAGPPPLVFTAGTAMTQAKALFAHAVAAAHALGERALLLSADPAQVPAALPAGVMYAPYAPFALLLPRARALVHHGGIGSSAQALRAGVPQLLLPHAYDQFDNAMRLEALGVARSLAARAVSAPVLAARLRALLADPAVDPACAAAAARLRVDQALPRIATAIEGLA
jgi:rhamnosyltransferase subunit B